MSGPPAKAKGWRPSAWELGLVVLILATAAWSSVLSPYYLSLDQILYSTRHFVIAEAEPPPVVDVIVELQIRRQRLPGRRAGLLGVGFEQYPDFGAKQLVRP